MRQFRLLCSKALTYWKHSVSGPCREFSSQNLASKSPETPLLKQLRARIKTYGPLTIADYMNECLTNPVEGYYMYQDVFGKKGDFITSPEVSQLFGEVPLQYRSSQFPLFFRALQLLAVWCVHELEQMENSAEIQIVEFGPGRGTLAADMQRTFSKIPGLDAHDTVTHHLVEVSPALRQRQAAALGVRETAAGHVSRHGVPVTWHDSLDTVPRRQSFFIAQEFFDALPIHQFQLDGNGKWREVFVDLDDDPATEHHLRYVLAQGDTLASTLLPPTLPRDPRRVRELSLQAGALMEQIARRVAEDGGGALVVDYGHNGDKEDTFRSYRQHEQQHPLREPGRADLTADVDFSYLRSVALEAGGDAVCAFGPIRQEMYLHNMGIGHRLMSMLRTDESLGQVPRMEDRVSLITGYDMLTNPLKMGARFKVFSLMPAAHCYRVNDAGQDVMHVPSGFKLLKPAVPLDNVSRK